VLSALCRVVAAICCTEADVSCSEAACSVVLSATAPLASAMSLALANMLSAPSRRPAMARLIGREMERASSHDSVTLIAISTPATPKTRNSARLASAATSSRYMPEPTIQPHSGTSFT
jgi:hypothetical protein